MAPKDIILIDTYGNQLEATISLPLGVQRVVVIAHGFESTKDSRLYQELESELNAMGLGTLRVTYFGHGPLYCSDIAYNVHHDITLPLAVASIHASIAYVRSLGIALVSLLGSSFGGLLSLIATAQDGDIYSLMLKSPVFDPSALWLGRLGAEGIQKWKESGMMQYQKLGEKSRLCYAFRESLQAYDMNTLAAQIICPVGIVHGTGDAVVPIENSYQIADITGASVSKVIGANHGYKETLEQRNEMKCAIIDFLKD